MIRAAGLALAAAVLTGCAAAPVRAPSVDAEVVCTGDNPDGTEFRDCPAFIAADTASRVLPLSGQAEWTMTGRAAVRHGDDGGSVRIEWHAQPGPIDEITLSVPISRQSWRLRIEPGQATLEGVPGGPLRAPDAETLLRQATGLSLPVNALRHWVRALPDPALPIVRRRYTTAGVLIGLEQGGWTLRFEPGTVRAGQWLPARVTAVRAQDSVRLVIEQWTPSLP